MNPHRSRFSQHPLVQLAIAFAAGIWAANYLSIKLSYALAAGALCSAVALSLVVKNQVQAAGAALLCAMFFAGVVLTQQEERAGSASGIKHLVEQSDNQPLTLTGWLDAPPEIARDRVYLSLHV